jgi:hypothetical protein
MITLEDDELVLRFPEVHEACGVSHRFPADLADS